MRIDLGHYGFGGSINVGAASGGGTRHSRVKIYSVKNADGSVKLFDPMIGVNADIRAANVPGVVGDGFNENSVGLRDAGGNAFNRSYRWRDSAGVMRTVYIGVNDNAAQNDLLALETTNGGVENFFFSGTNNYNSPVIVAAWNEFIVLDLAVFIFGAPLAVILNDDTPGLQRFRVVGGANLPNHSRFVSRLGMQHVLENIPAGTQTQISVGQLQELTTLALALPASGGNTSTGWQLTPPDDPDGHGITELELTLSEELKGFRHPSGDPIITGVSLPRDYVAPSQHLLAKQDGGLFTLQGGDEIGLHLIS